MNASDAGDSVLVGEHERSDGELHWYSDLTDFAGDQHDRLDVEQTGGVDDQDHESGARGQGDGGRAGAENTFPQIGDDGSVLDGVDGQDGTGRNGDFQFTGQRALFQNVDLPFGGTGDESEEGVFVEGDVHIAG